MPCVHLQELFELCEKHDLKITSHDAIQVVCRQCQQQDVCPSSLTDGEKVLGLGERDQSSRPKKDDED